MQVRLGVRTGRLVLAGTTVLCVGLVLAVTASMDSLYPTLADRLQYAATVGTSTGTQTFNGRGYGLTTSGGIAAYEIGFMGQLVPAVLALYLAVRWTRGEEEGSRLEVVSAGRLGRLAPVIAGAVTVVGVAAAVGVLTAGGMAAVGLPGSGAIWYAAGLGLFMVFFGAVGLLLGQLAQTARTAFLLGLAGLTAAFLVRALVDGTGADAVWLSPLGWLAEVRAFDGPQAWPPAAYAIGATASFVGAAAVARRRDLGAGVIAERSGPSGGRPQLSTTVGLAWRLNRASLVSWTAMAVVWASVFGALTGEMADLIESNPTMLEALGLERGEDIIASLAIVVIIGGATSLGVQTLSRLASEEASDRLGALLATRVARTRLWLAWCGVAAGGALVVLFTGAFALGVTTWSATADSGAIGRMLGVGVGYAVPVVFVVVLGAALLAVHPWLVALVWLVVGWVTVVGFLAETLDLPDWARDLSPVHLVGELPRQDPDLLATICLAVACGCCVLASVRSFGRRDLTVG